MRRTQNRALDAFLIRQRETLRSRIGAGWSSDRAFNLARWNGELERDLIAAGMPKKRARERARSINEEVLRRLTASEPLENIYESLRP